MKRQRMIKTRNKRYCPLGVGCFFFAIAQAGLISSLNAHPHVYIEVRNAIVFDEQQHLVSIEVFWRFDEFYSAFAIQGLDTNNDGQYSSDELSSLLQDNLEEMGKTNFYTYTTVNGTAQSYKKAVDPQTFYEDGLLGMRFSLVLTTPVKVFGKTITIATYDPTYYIALDLAEQQPARLLGDNIDKCTMTIKRPDQSEPVNLDDSIATTNASIARSYAEQFASRISVKCSP